MRLSCRTETSHLKSFTWQQLLLQVRGARGEEEKTLIAAYQKSCDVPAGKERVNLSTANLLDSS